MRWEEEKNHELKLNWMEFDIKLFVSGAKKTNNIDFCLTNVDKSLSR